jgi:hypothetical protein
LQWVQGEREDGGMDERAVDAVDDVAGSYRTGAVASQPEELRRIMSTGTIWTAAAIVAPGIALGPLLASGWRPYELPLAAAIVWWVGVAVAAIGLCLLVWAGCPVLAFTPQDAYRQKVFCIRVGIVMNLAGMTVAGLVLLAMPH